MSWLSSAQLQVADRRADLRGSELEKKIKNQAKANPNHNGLSYDNILSLTLLRLLFFLNSL